MADLPRKADLFDEEACHPIPGTHILSIAVVAVPGSSVDIALKATIVGDPDVGIEDSLIDPAYLLEAVTVPGAYVVFNCGCGCPGCAGLDTVKVQVDDDVVWWRWYRPGDRLRHEAAVRDRDNAAAAEFAPRVAVFTRARLEPTVVAALDVRAVIMRALRAEGLGVEEVPPDTY